MKVFGNLIAHIEAFNEPILRNFEQLQFFDFLAQLLKYFNLIPFFDAILFFRPFLDIMSNDLIKYYVLLEILPIFKLRFFEKSPLSKIWENIVSYRQTG